jgi:hypothetical protein
MATSPPKYQAAWLQAEEVFELFAQAGIDRKAAAQWLEAIWRDRGCPSIWSQHPDPARDLFRHAPLRLVHVDRATTWRHGEIDWNALIQYCDILCDVDDSRLVGLPIEVSRQQLVMLLPKQKSKTGRKGYSRDALKKCVHELMEYHGDFSPDDKEWNGLPKLIARLEDEFGASRSILYKTVPAMVDDWKKSRNSKN